MNISCSVSKKCKQINHLNCSDATRMKLLLKINDSIAWPKHSVCSHTIKSPTAALCKHVLLKGNAQFMLDGSAGACKRADIKRCNHGGWVTTLWFQEPQAYSVTVNATVLQLNVLNRIDFSLSSVVLFKIQEMSVVEM